MLLLLLAKNWPKCFQTLATIIISTITTASTETAVSTSTAYFSLSKIGQSSFILRLLQQQQLILTLPHQHQQHQTTTASTETTTDLAQDVFVFLKIFFPKSEAEFTPTDERRS